MSAHKRQESIRAVDISNELCVTQSAVLKAERKLADDGYITLGAHKRIFLTRKGIIRAEKIYERYTVFTDILKSCGVPENLAEETACKMEHTVSDTVFEYIKKDIENKG